MGKPLFAKIISSIKSTTFLDALRPQQPIVWLNVVFYFLLHILSVYFLIVYALQFRLLTWTWNLFVLILSGFGTTAGVHRLWAHRSFKVKTPLKITILLSYTATGTFPVKDWARNHRVHHKFSDTDGDPHNITRGFFFAHIGWLLQRKHPEVRKQQVKVDISDITGDPLIAFHDRHFTIMRFLVAYFFPTVIPVLIWNETLFLASAANCIRLCFGMNMTWLVNSAAHTWGYKPYNKDILPGEIKFLNLFVLGEGWHNYHHQFPWDYRASEVGFWLFNLTTKLLELFIKLGWVYDVKTVSPTVVSKTALKHGDGSLLVSSITNKDNKLLDLFESEKTSKKFEDFEPQCFKPCSEAVHPTPPVTKEII